MDYDIIIVGGGFFGMYISEYFAKKKRRVLLVEREQDCMRRASYHNQARVHNGYHYPRSVLTALRSRISFPRFIQEYSDCVVSDFQKFYLIGSPLGKVSAYQFQKFCERIGAPCEVAPTWLRRLTNPHFVEACFSTVEYAFDATALRDTMLQRLNAVSVEIRLGTTVEGVRQKAGALAVSIRNTDSSAEELTAAHVFNCTYSNINFLLANSGAPPIPLKHEMTEMCIVEVPDEIRQSGITVMCGPFFSVMPFPALGLHSVSHVRYTPHYEWLDEGGDADGAQGRLFDARPGASAWEAMRKDAARYIPVLSECRYSQSLWEVKTVLPRSETDDSRPILFRPNHGLPGLHSVLGGKIDNVYDVVKAIEVNSIGL
ncbi:NAD(P)/FAD-dependent oxidoreductase [Nitrospirillum amazonense]|uniref:NAD(P)/FAD-dependent oxidoreductase n=1 Tax=Nitrospirillum amazonense TaxID=28077 RepID=UPI002412C8C9|nr:FAD-dependent oxidoreductase [Nitrospirillum amazonense]MDG3438848.1 FAD-dependent oxidoreductase [Nitrospirillum amazonense]